MRVFLAAPFSSKYDKKEKKFDILLKDLIMGIIELLEKRGFKVFSSQVVEEWGNKMASPDKYLPRDIEEFKKSEIMIALIDENTSGVYVELGWGLILRKKMVALVKGDVKIPEFIDGILKTNKVKIIHFDFRTDLLAKLSKCLTEIMEEEHEKNL